MLTKHDILEQFALFRVDTGGLGSWITEATDDKVFDRLGNIDGDPVTKVQLNQLLAFGHEAPVSDDFFRYYWINAAGEHPYDVKLLPDYSDAWARGESIVSLSQLKWGLYRIYIDGLLYFGNVRAAFRKLRSLNGHELSKF